MNISLLMSMFPNLTNITMLPATSPYDQQLSMPPTSQSDTEGHPFSFSDIHLAVLRGDIPKLHDLFENKSSLPDLESRSRSMTPLQAAGHYGHYNLLPILLEHGASVNAEPSEFGCALQASISSVKHNGTPDKLWQNDTVMMSSKQGEQERAVHLLLEAGADVNRQGGEFGSPLGAAAAFGMEDIVDGLLSRGADPSSSGGRLGTALTAASAKGGMPVWWCISLVEPEAYLRIVERLLRTGADVNQVGGIYGTALQAAASVGEVGIVKMLLMDGKANPNVKAGKYASALGAAAYAGNLDVIKILLSAGAEVGPMEYHPDKPDNWDTWREEPVCSLVFKYGAPLPNTRAHVSRARAEEAKTDDPIQLAFDRGHREIVRVLMENRPK